MSFTAKHPAMREYLVIGNTSTRFKTIMVRAWGTNHAKQLAVNALSTGEEVFTPNTVISKKTLIEAHRSSN